MAFLGQIGLEELLVILAVVVVLFGAKRIPEIGASLGKTIREFKRGFSSSSDHPDEPRTLPRD